MARRLRSKNMQAMPVRILEIQMWELYQLRIALIARNSSKCSPPNPKESKSSNLSRRVTSKASTTRAYANVSITCFYI